MQAFLCDLCGQRVDGRLLEVHHIGGEAVRTEDGRLRLTQRGDVEMFYLCLSCAEWMRGAMRHLRTSLGTS